MIKQWIRRRFRMAFALIGIGSMILSPLPAGLQAQQGDVDGSTEAPVADPRKPIQGIGKSGLDSTDHKQLQVIKGFHLVEASIDDIHKAIRGGKITCTQLIQLYLNRIAAYSGTCTSYLDGSGSPKPPDLVMPSGKGIELGTQTPIANAGQLNAFSNVNVRGQRSETDLADTDPSMPDALEVAAHLDAQFGRRLSGPLHCIPIAIKDQVDTFDMRTTDAAIADYADDRPPEDAEAVARLRAAGAIIIGKANMGEYAAGSRSTYQGQACNPYATERNPGGSSSGSGSSVAANLAVCAIAEESLGSIRNPASNQGIVGFAQTRGLVSREGNFRANLIRERLGPHCRFVKDTAIVLDAIAGYDPNDPITAESVGHIPDEGYVVHANKKNLKNKRIGVIRELVTRFSVVDEESVRLTNQAIADMKAAGAVVVESFNKRDCVLFGECGDPAIPEMQPTIQDAIEEILPYADPGFVGPADPAGAWPVLSRVISSFSLPAPFANFMDYIVAVFFTPSLFPHSPTETVGNNVINIRRLAASTPSGEFNEGKYAFNRYLKNRGDTNIKSIADLRDVVTPCTQAMFDADQCGKGRALFVGKNPPSDTGTRLDTPGEAGHIIRQQALRQIILHVMAANDLDVLIYPHHTVPAGLLGGTGPVTIDNRPTGGYNALTDVSGLPDIVVPAGINKEAYNVVPCATPGSISDPGAPSGQCLLKQAVTLPFNLSFLGKPFDEAGMFEVVSAYEFVTHHRAPPADFGPLPGEP